MIRIYIAFRSILRNIRYMLRSYIEYNKAIRGLNEYNILYTGSRWIDYISCHTVLFPYDAAAIYWFCINHNLFHQRSANEITKLVISVSNVGTSVEGIKAILISKNRYNVEET